MLPIPKTSPTPLGTQSDDDQDLKLHEVLSLSLAGEVFRKSPMFVVADQDGKAVELKSDDVDKTVMAFPAVSFCVCVAFRVQGTGTWYGLHINPSSPLGPIKSFKKLGISGFSCDKVIVMNYQSPDPLQNQTYAQACITELGGDIQPGAVKSIQCFTSGKSPHNEGRRQIMLVPEDGNIYLFDENAQYLGSVAL